MVVGCGWIVIRVRLSIRCQKYKFPTGHSIPEKEESSAIPFTMVVLEWHEEAPEGLSYQPSPPPGLIPSHPTLPPKV
ncbi:hypothetical protein V1477_020170 [Vespula maculifrons]|uniref:Uncharacterized protein n=2 Tax=Vespula TaxID=7451 RepID=A0A834KAD4_VESVU|nr:hypothetical protein HZH66_005132 [Vespula vulgaris]